MAKERGRHFSEEDTQTAEEHMERCSASAAARGTQVRAADAAPGGTQVRTTDAAPRGTERSEKTDSSKR